VSVGRQKTGSMCRLGVQRKNHGSTIKGEGTGTGLLREVEQHGEDEGKNVGLSRDNGEGGLRSG